MAMPAKTLYISIVEQATHKTVEMKQCLNAKIGNEWLKTMAEKYPAPHYYIHKETY